MKKSRLLGAVCACFITFAVPSVYAASIDQYFDTDIPKLGAYTFLSQHNHAQTFTVGISGGLTYIDILISRHELSGTVIEPVGVTFWTRQHWSSKKVVAMLSLKTF